MADPEAEDPPPAARRRRLPLKKKLLFMGVALLLGVLAVEGTLRLLGYPKGFLRSTKAMWATDAERKLGPMRPGLEVTIRWPPELEYTAKINALGTRGPLPTPNLPLVLCVGDSTTFGSHVAEEETYPVQLAGLLPQATVLNAGVPRWTVTDQNEFLERALPELKPKVVVLLFCGNDLLELDKKPARERALKSRTLWSDLRSKLAIPEAFLLLSMESRRSYLKAKGRWPQEMREDQGRTEGWARAQWKRYADGLRKTKALAADHGAHLIVAAFPGFLEIEDTTCAVEQNLPGIARAVGAEYVDLYAPFRASPEGRFLLPHDAHASKTGNALIASVLKTPVANALRSGGE